jgi:hypothetical protein
MVYKFRLISNEKEDFIRDFEVRSDQSFYDLHQAIQKNLYYDQSQIASFFLCNDRWEKAQEITLFDLSDEPDQKTMVMDNTRFSEHIHELKQKLLYVFDVFNERAFFIEVAEIKEDSPGKSYPACTLSKGSPPVQIIMDQVFLTRDPSLNFDDTGIETTDEDSLFNDSDFDDIIHGDKEPDEE